MTSFATNGRNSYIFWYHQSRGPGEDGPGALHDAGYSQNVVCGVCKGEKRFLWRLVFILFSAPPPSSLLFTLHRAPHNERERKREKKLAKRNCSLLKGGIGEHRHSSRLPSSDHDRPRFILLNNSLGSAFSFLHLSTFHCRSHHVQYSRY